MTKDLTFERDAAIRKCYDELLDCVPDRRHIKKNRMVDMVYRANAPRFYISPKWAEYVVFNYYRGVHVAGSNLRKQMAEDLAANYERLKQEHEDYSQEEIFAMLVCQPAKSFYVSRITIKSIIYGWRKRF